MILEQTVNADCISIYGPILYGLEVRLNAALNSVERPRRSRLGVILETPGGVVEVVDRMVQSIRHLYQEVYFFIPNTAMSAGTVFAMSGDKIFMSYFSALGPIDPQIQKDGKLVPALGYISEFEALVAKSSTGQLTTADYALLSKFDLGELHTFKQARDLSVELLEKWLSTYKFKDWEVTKSQGKRVDAETRKTRAKQVAETLINHERWHSHSRCISAETLREELNIQIEDYWDKSDLRVAIHGYFDVFVDFLAQRGQQSFVHSAYYV